MDHIPMIESIRTFPEGFNQISDTLICQRPHLKVPDGFGHPMEFALMKVMTELNDRMDLDLQLFRVQSVKDIAMFVKCGDAFNGFTKAEWLKIREQFRRYFGLVRFLDTRNVNGLEHNELSHNELSHNGSNRVNHSNPIIPIPTNQKMNGRDDTQSVVFNAENDPEAKYEDHHWNRKGIGNRNENGNDCIPSNVRNAEPFPMKLESIAQPFSKEQSIVSIQNEQNDLNENHVNQFKDNLYDYTFSESDDMDCDYSMNMNGNGMQSKDPKHPMDHHLDADIESGNSDYLPTDSAHETKRHKKDPKQIRKERELREKRKEMKGIKAQQQIKGQQQIQNVPHFVEPVMEPVVEPVMEQPAQNEDDLPPHSIFAEHCRVGCDPSSFHSNIAPPPDLHSSDEPIDYGANSNLNHNRQAVHPVPPPPVPPVPDFQAMYNKKESIRRALPRFEFSSDLSDINISDSPLTHNDDLDVSSSYELPPMPPRPQPPVRKKAYFNLDNHNNNKPGCDINGKNGNALSHNMEPSPFQTNINSINIDCDESTELKVCDDFNRLNLRSSKDSKDLKDSKRDHVDVRGVSTLSIPNQSQHSQSIKSVKSNKPNNNRYQQKENLNSMDRGDRADRGDRNQSQSQRNSNNNLNAAKSSKSAKSMNHHQRNKKERTGPPVMADLFGDTQQHSEYREFHSKSRNEKMEKLKSAPSTDLNPKNCFLLPILLEFDHTIGSRIGSHDYGFHSFSGNANCFTGRDSNSYLGVDYPVPDKEKRDDSDMVKTAKTVLAELMQSTKHEHHQNIAIKDRYHHKGNRCSFWYQNQVIATGSGPNKKEREKECAQNVLMVFKEDPRWSDTLGISVEQIECGIKSSKQKSRAIGYEYATIIMSGGGSCKYIINEINENQHNMNGLNGNRVGIGNRNGNGLIPLVQATDIMQRLEIFQDVYRDRNGGQQINDHSDPPVRRLYHRQWSKFKGKRNVPIHCHPHLTKWGYLKRSYVDTQDEMVQEMWMEIWKIYRSPRRDNDNQSQSDYQPLSFGNNGNNGNGYDHSHSMSQIQSSHSNSKIHHQPHHSHAHFQSQSNKKRASHRREDGGYLSGGSGYKSGGGRGYRSNGYQSSRSNHSNQSNHSNRSHSSDRSRNSNNHRHHRSHRNHNQQNQQNQQRQRSQQKDRDDRYRNDRMSPNAQNSSSNHNHPSSHHQHHRGSSVRSHSQSHSQPHSHFNNQHRSHSHHRSHSNRNHRDDSASVASVPSTESSWKGLQNQVNQMNEINDSMIPPHLRDRHSSKQYHHKVQQGGQGHSFRPLDRRCTHLVIYDFDGTIYTKRLWKEIQHHWTRNVHYEGMLEPRHSVQFIQKLGVNAIYDGFGGMQRVETLKRHFADLKKCRPQWAVVLLTFNHKKALEMLFDAFGIRLNHWFDITLANQSEIVQNLVSQRSGARFKEMAIRSLCKETGINLKNVLYVDDDSKVDIRCCETMFVSKRRSHCGMTKDEMKGILHRVHEIRAQSRNLMGQQRMGGFMGLQGVQIPIKKICVLCGNVDDVEMMQCMDEQGETYLCSDCCKQDEHAQRQ